MKKIMLYKVLPLLAVALMGLAMATSCEEENNVSGNSGNNGGDETPVGWVDLGLPSGLLWAESNVGATAPEQYGDYFAWGETQPKSVYDWRNYIYCSVNESTGDPDTLTKYNTLASYGIPDSLTVLLPGDDAATANMGNGARTPTREDWQELLDNTTSEWTTLNGVYGLQFSANGKTLFLPAAGYFKDSDIYFIDGEQSYGYYSSASLNGNNPLFICDFYFYSETQSLIDNYNFRSTGLSVRAVRAGRK